MTLLDAAEELASQNSHSSHPTAVQEHKSGKLLNALAEHSQVEEKRGFLLDAALHHGLVTILYALFFSGDVLSRTVDKSDVTTMLLRDMTKREPWTAAQRWRALAASAGGSRLSSSSVWKTSLAEQTQSIVALFAWVHRQPLETFEPLVSKIETHLESLFNDANQLSITSRRDVLSTRMSVVVAPESKGTSLPFDPNRINSVWADMGPVKGDEVISLHKFGLKRMTEQGQGTLLIKPEVTTAALLREMAKT
ncbi:hypothetical protein B0H17DRAFT_1080865 [Mycena rosella]|uniref:Uncharacterized protein n=1 Tax=Mycena rosella TaxID=1033263 RepID=A0AAD7D2G1_MYCRO|nr:hypothetical protein B0H17DRAFT_1080865 [Mycena rosella]